MPIRTIIVFSGGSDHTAESGSHGFCMGDRTAMSRMDRDGDCVMAAATHGLEKTDRRSTIVSHGFDERNRVAAS